MRQGDHKQTMKLCDVLFDFSYMKLLHDTAARQETVCRPVVHDSRKDSVTSSWSSPYLYVPLP